MSCFIVSIYGIVQVKGGKRNGYEKDRRISKNTSQRKRIDTGTTCGDSSCIGKNNLTMGNRNKYADLSILIQMAEFYAVDVKEILDGERKGENMDKELKETLIKVADYSKLEKEKAAKTGNIAFGLSFALCVVMIMVQLIVTGNLMYVAGETIVLLFGGIVYIGMMSYNGIYETNSKFKSPFTDAVISIICATIFTIALAIYYAKMGADISQIVYVALIFFIGISIVGFAVLRFLAYFSHKRKNKIMENSAAFATEQQVVNVFVADGNMQANMIINTLKDNGIMAYGQDLGDAGFAAVRYGMGRGIDDRVAIIVASDKADSAKQVIKEMGLE